MVQEEFDPYALLDTLRAGGDIDLIRTSVELVLQALIEAEATTPPTVGSTMTFGAANTYQVWAWGT
jgi:hypothetical protein